ncbi:MAG: hypothetical protein QOJ61_4102 [Mycobacterium sp.]|nr:hypothetical protein [Mycobacterium sp.]
MVAAPLGVAITTRLRTAAADEAVLDAVADHVGRLRRADLAAVSRPRPLAPASDAETRRQARRDRLNARKARLTAESSSRWANTIIGANDDQHRLARDAQYRHIVGLRAAISTIEIRLAQPTAGTLTADERKAHRKSRLPKGYATQSERFHKQRRLQVLVAELDRTSCDRDRDRVRVVDGGKRLVKTRQNLDAARLTPLQWREQWDCARYRIKANGSGDEPFGNLTITVTPGGAVSVRLPKPLEHRANAPRGRYVLSSQAGFAHRAPEWLARINGGRSVSYTIARKPGRAGRYLTAAWATTPCPADGPADVPGTEVRARAGGGRGPQRRAPSGGAPRRARKPRWPAATHRFRPHGWVRAARCPSPPRDHPADPLHPPPRCHHDRCGRPRLRRRAHRGARDHGPRPARQTLPQGGGRGPDRGVPQPVGLSGRGRRHHAARGQPRLHQCMGRSALAQALHERHSAPGGRHGDRASRPRPQGTATGRCDSYATRGSRRESYQPGRTPKPTGEQ